MSNNIHVLIIEDEPAAVRQLKRLLQQVAIHLSINIDVVADLDSNEAAVAWLKMPTNTVDVAFFDIQLSDGLSFEILEQVQVSFPIIFATAFDDYAIRAFKVNSIDYLLKPYSLEDLQGAIQKFQNRRAHQLAALSDAQNLLGLLNDFKQQATNPSSKVPFADYKSRFLVKKGQQFISIPVSTIAFIYSEDKVTFIQNFNEKQKHILNYSLDDIENMLDPKKFFRLNRQVLVAYSAIERVHKYFNGKLLVELRPQPTFEERVVVSRDKAASFKRWLDQ